MGQRLFAGMFAAAAALVPAVAQAETLTITGEFPARYREAGLLRSVSVGRISGQDGHALQLALERALTNTHFDVLAGRGANAEGTLSGVVTTGVQETPYKKQEKKCTEKDDNGKCTKEEEVDVRCRRRIVNINADLRMVDNVDNRIVYSADKPFREEISWCEGQSAYRTVEDTVAAALRDMANDVRFDVAPYVDTYKVRVRETTKGMAKDLAKQFKAVVKQSQRDPRSACQAWQGMAASAPPNASITFNVALCSEQRGDYDGALRLYRDAMRLIGGDGDEARVGAERAQRLINGRADAAERARRG